METLNVDFFGRDELPELSIDRNTYTQLQKMFAYYDNPNMEVYAD